MRLIQILLALLMLFLGTTIARLASIGIVFQGITGPFSPLYEAGFLVLVFGLGCVLVAQMFKKG